MFKHWMEILYNDDNGYLYWLFHQNIFVSPEHYNKKAPQLDSSIDTVVNLIDLIDQPQGVHKIKTTLLSISLPKLYELQSLALESTMNLLNIELQPSF